MEMGVYKVLRQDPDGRNPTSNTFLIQAMQSWGQAGCRLKVVTEYGGLNELENAGV
jgi:hypothetical protein